MAGVGNKGVERTGSISAHNNTQGYGHNPYSGSGLSPAARPGGSAASTNGGPADRYSPTLSRDAVSEQELWGLMKMIEENNHTIRDHAQRMKPESDARIPVPHLLGLAAATAAARVNAVGLTVSRISRKNHPHIPLGSIAGQIPAPGTQVSAGAGIHIIVSRGPGDSLARTAGGTRPSVSRTLPDIPD
ncbi:PASTA domain-containing protein [Ruminococcaceae bacterium OttesenSCG-928-L11]|nr:PASTA domain-containing protein [Ruminococcaceae bacterium OttesenSCG-928-L11]